MNKNNIVIKSSQTYEKGDKKYIKNTSYLFTEGIVTIGNVEFMISNITQSGCDINITQSDKNQAHCILRSNKFASSLLKRKPIKAKIGIPITFSDGTKNKNELTIIRTICYN
jgi:hypothetical protein